MWGSTLGCIVTLTLSMLAVPCGALAQPVRQMPRIGILAPGSPPRPTVEAFRQGLRDLGYVEGQTMALEIRWDENKAERWPGLAAELVALRMDIIVAGHGGITEATRQATGTIPIVMVAAAYPVEAGLVASLARPGGNITGLSLMTPELNQKRLEMLKETVPSLSRVAVLWDASMAPTLQWEHFETAARVLGIQLQLLEVRSPNDLDGALAAARREGVQAMITAQQPFFSFHRGRVAALALQYRVPTMSADVGFAEVGGLMTYGTNIAGLWHRAATYVDKILKGAKPADLPVEQPTTFELVLNLKTAQALGLTFPPHLLVLADKIIQ
jgi:putative ABC transport system substrate-binding protein